MRSLKLPAIVLGPVLLLSACANEPLGPTVGVMPAPGKPFDVFQGDQAICKQFASDQVQGGSQQANNQQIGTAVVGTLLGAGLGAAIGGGRGAAIGAGAGAWEVPRLVLVRRRARSTACSSAMTWLIRSACTPVATRCPVISHLSGYAAAAAAVSLCAGISASAAGLSLTAEGRSSLARK